MLKRKWNHKTFSSFTSLRARALQRWSFLKSQSTTSHRRDSGHHINKSLFKKSLSVCVCVHIGLGKGQQFRVKSSTIYYSNWILLKCHLHLSFLDYMSRSKITTQVFFLYAPLGTKGWMQCYEIWSLSLYKQDKCTVKSTHNCFNYKY